MTTLAIELQGDSSQGSVHIRIISSDPIEPIPLVLVVEIAEHGPNAVRWVATVPCAVDHSEHEQTWIGVIPAMPGRERLWTIMRIFEQIEVTSPEDSMPAFPTEGRIFDFSPALHLEAAASEPWSSGPAAEVEERSRRADRESRFNAPLLAEGATAKSQRYAALVVVENLLVSQSQVVPGIELVPLVRSTLGLDVAVIMNAVLPQLGYPELVHQERWLEEQSQARPSGFIHIRDIRADSDPAMHGLVVETVRQFLDLVALRRYAGARVVAGISMKLDEGGNWLGHTWSPISGYAGNLAVGMISGEDPDSLVEQWEQVQQDPRAQLWLSLYRDCLGEAVPDYRFLRMFNLLEGIAKGIAAPGTPVSDPAGMALLQENRRPYTTTHARGALYNLFSEIARAGSQNLQNFASPIYVEDGAHSFAQRIGDIWEELQVWVSVRNLVAHSGTVRVSNPAASKSRQELERKLEAYGFDGRANSGFGAILHTISRDCESVLYAALAGRL